MLKRAREELRDVVTPAKLRHHAEETEETAEPSRNGSAPLTAAARRTSDDDVQAHGNDADSPEHLLTDVASSQMWPAHVTEVDDEAVAEEEAALLATEQSAKQWAGQPQEENKAASSSQAQGRCSESSLGSGFPPLVSCWLLEEAASRTQIGSVIDRLAVVGRAPERQEPPEDGDDEEVEPLMLRLPMPAGCSVRDFDTIGRSHFTLRPEHDGSMTVTVISQEGMHDRREQPLYWRYADCGTASWNAVSSGATRSFEREREVTLVLLDSHEPCLRYRLAPIVAHLQTSEETDHL